MIGTQLKLSIILLLFLVGVTSCSDEESSKKQRRSLTPVKFISPYNNTNFKRGEVFSLEIAIDDLEKMESLKVFTKDTTIFKGKPTDAKLSYEVTTSDWPTGTVQLSLEGRLKDGSTRKDNRIVRILSDVYPVDYNAEVVTIFPHSTSSYTQGLEFDNGTLFEGTGGMGATGGESMIARVDLKTGEILQRYTLEKSLFGEGITIMGDQLYQLTWQNNVCFVYDKNTFEKLKEFSFSGEGWGLCNDGNSLIMSDGSERLYFRNPENFNLIKTIEVYTNSGPIKMLNELEYINGKIYANVYQTNNIVIIHPKTGIVEGIIDASLLALEHKKGGDVLNGIAYQQKTDRLFITGKNWPSLLEIKIVKQ